MILSKPRRFLISVLTCGIFVGASQPPQCPQNIPTEPFEAKVLIDQVSIAGQDCEETTDVLSVDDVSNDVRLHFKKFSIENSLRKSCNIRVPVDVVEGHKLIVSAQSLKGSVVLSEGATGRVQARILLTGNKDHILEEMVEGPIARTIEILDHPTSAVLEGECGKDIILGVNANLLLRNRDASDRISLNAIELGLQTKPCEENELTE